MCIILGEVHSVTQTKLFVLANKDKTRQMTFYSNAVNTPKENMMVLPVPGIAELHTIDYKNMFTDLKQSVKRIYQESPSYTTNTRSLSCSASIPRDTLEIIAHGSYYVSIAPTLEDLLRLDTRVFTLTPELLQFFAKHYNDEFSYICCVLTKGSEAYEPLCYSHPLHSSDGFKKLFVPTLHYHGHGYGHLEIEYAHWDHTIYSVGTEERANRGFTSTYYNSVNWSKFPEDYEKLDISSIRCTEIKGYSKNIDIAFALY